MTFLPRVLRDRRAVSALEFALLAPVVLIIMLAGADTFIMLRNQFALERVSSQMGEVVSQCQAVSLLGDMPRFKQEAQLLAGSNLVLTDANPIHGGGNFIITAASNGPANAPVINWQYAAGNPSYGSAFTLSNSGACSSGGICVTPTGVTLPNNYVVPKGQVLIITETVAPIKTWNFAAAFAGFGKSGTFTSRYYSMFMVRAPNPQNMATVDLFTLNQKCGS